MTILLVTFLGCGPTPNQRLQVGDLGMSSSTHRGLNHLEAGHPGVIPPEVKGFV